MKFKTIKPVILGALIGLILSFPLLFTLNWLEADKPWTEERHDGICPLHRVENQNIDSPNQTNCERAYELGMISLDGEVYAGKYVCYKNVEFETDWKCITSVIYYPIFNFINPSGCTDGLWIIFYPIISIYGAIVGSLIGFLYILVRKSNNKKD